MQANLFRVHQISREKKKITSNSVKLQITRESNEQRDVNLMSREAPTSRPPDVATHFVPFATMSAAVPLLQVDHDENESQSHNLFGNIGSSNGPTLNTSRTPPVVLTPTDLGSMATNPSDAEAGTLICCLGPIHDLYLCGI